MIRLALVAGALAADVTPLYSQSPSPRGAVPGAAQVRSGENAARAVSETLLERHLRVLAHDSLEGRGAGKRGEQLAARYIAAQFQRLGLQATGDSGTYLQHFAFSASTADPVGRIDAELVKSRNVVGCLPGAGGTAEYVLLGGHYDGFGIGRPRGGDSIYNGALDNASGVATMLAVAEALVTSSAKPRRAICFAAFGAEERGLRGSQAYVTALRDTAKVVGMINIDGANIWGRTRDVALLGDDLSTLGADFRRAAAAESLSVTVHEDEIRKNFYYRSDHILFANAGIPALFFRRGKELVEGGAALWEERSKDYYGGHYHGPSDEVLDWHSVDGAAQQARVAVRLLLDVADAAGRPAWNEDAVFWETSASGRRFIKMKPRRP